MSSYGFTNTRSGVNHWLRFYVDNRELVIPKIAISYYINFNQIYSKGLAYGVNNNGPYVPYSYIGTNDVLQPQVNQYKTFTIKNKMYLVRLMRGANADKELLKLTNPSSNIDRSEFNRIFYPILREEDSVSFYNDIRLADYSLAELGFTNKTENGQQAYGFYSICQERIDDPIRGIYYNRLTRSEVTSQCPCFSSNNAYGWRPVLELIE